MAVIEQPNIPRSSATFEFTSHYPVLHMPHYRFENPDCVNPKSPLCVTDGELVYRNQKGLIERLTAATIAAALTRSSQILIFHGKTGRSDLQASGGGPVADDSGFNFRTKLVDPTATVQHGTRMTAGIIASGPYTGVCGWVPAASGAEYLATVNMIEGGGWYAMRFERGRAV